MTHRIHNPDTDADIELRSYLDAKARPCFVMVAGAGSGKTTSLVKALDHVGKRHGKTLQKNGQQIACITYTEIATEEIWGDVGNNPLFHVSTIHSFLWTLAKPFQKDIASCVRSRIEEKLEGLRQTRANFGPRVLQKTKDSNARETAHLIAQLERIETVPSFTYENGSDYLKGILGHDDIINIVPHLIKTYPLFSKIVARRYPFFFVDESQDTFPEVTEALKTVAVTSPGLFCLGFFGDPMQKIYGHGVGDITLADGHKRIAKPENFRCPKSVLTVINKIRAGGDSLQQSRGRMSCNDGKWQSVEGSAKLFVLPADLERTQNLNHVRRWMAKSLVDDLWVSESKEADVRILVIVHRMAATRLGFPDLFAAFNDGSPESFVAGFREGTGWALKPFLDALIPLCSAFVDGRDFDAMMLIRAFCPRVDAEVLRAAKSPGKVFVKLKGELKTLSELMAQDGNATVLDVLRFARETELIKLDERFASYLEPISKNKAEVSPASTERSDTDEGDKLASAMSAYLACPANQFWGYHSYLMEASPFSTQQGIKGAEFARVIVVLDDEESKHRQFSYDKLLGLSVPSKTDLQNQADGKETVFDRTRRLFYVCCSRATKDLAVVLYIQDVDNASDRIKALGLFEPKDILTLKDIL